MDVVSKMSVEALRNAGVTETHISLIRGSPPIGKSHASTPSVCRLSLLSIHIGAPISAFKAPFLVLEDKVCVVYVVCGLSKRG